MISPVHDEHVARIESSSPATQGVDVGKTAEHGAATIDPGEIGRVTSEHIGRRRAWIEVLA